MQKGTQSQEDQSLLPSGHARTDEPYPKSKDEKWLEVFHRMADAPIGRVERRIKQKEEARHRLEERRGLNSEETFGGEINRTVMREVERPVSIILARRTRSRFGRNF